ncbi:EamA family transporter [Allosaccharopolyspora coralli]|uniref:EamA family transporter n=1 Tax=Allosaccharopolyspora coralli TaxID=2665642 RepID=A0A5Q3Q718_9PSEU|nr:EamA family transporter [Allosaccharopolyspora coralli]
MPTVPALLLAFTAALGYGLSDFVGGLASRRTHVLHVVLVSYPVSVVLVALVAPLAGGNATAAAMAWGAASGVAGGLAVLWFYAALATGPMSVVSPVTAVLTSALPMLGGLALGERPGPWALVGAVLAVGAVVLVSKEERSTVDEGAPARFTAKVMLLTVGSGVMFALYFMLLHRIEAGAGLWPVFASRVVASVTVLVAAIAFGQLRFARGVPATLALAAGALDVIANITMLYALQMGMLSLVSVIASLYPAATVLMARLVLGERSGRVQQVGLVLAAVSVALIAGAS